MTYFPGDPLESQRASERMYEADARARGDMGWVDFGAVFLVIAGIMHGIWGLHAIGGSNRLEEAGLHWGSLTAWGWVALLVGVLQIAVGVFVGKRSRGVRWLAIIVAGLGLFFSFLSVGAYPLWSVIAIVANAGVLWAVTVHGNEFE